MQGPSHVALIEARQALEQALGGLTDRVRLSEDLHAVAGVVHGSGVLRRTLTDPSREGTDRADLVDRLFGGRIGEPAQQVARAAAAQRWTTSGDLPRAIQELAVEALLADAQANGRLGRVEDELFRFQRIVGGDSRLLGALSDPQATAAGKVDLVAELLSGKAAPETVRLARHAVASRTDRFTRAIEGYLAIAARRQEQVAAVVISAVPLTDRQLDTLVSTLSAQYNRPVHANVVVDPDVVGGIRVEIGDEIIEGTIRSRLDDARRRLTS